MPINFSFSQADTVRLLFFSMPSMQARSSTGLRSARVEARSNSMNWSVDIGTFILYSILYSVLILLIAWPFLYIPGEIRAIHNASKLSIKLLILLGFVPHPNLRFTTPNNDIFNNISHS